MFDQVDLNQPKLGTRYWTVLKYLSILYLLYMVVSVVLGWTSYRTAIVMPALLALALWRPRPISWLFLLGSLGIATFSYANPAIHGLGYIGKVQVVGWGTPYDEELLRTQYAVLAMAALLTAMYLAKRKTLFVPSGTRFLWLRGIGAVLLALLIADLPRAERVLDPGWGPRDMQRYVRAFRTQETPKAANPHVNESQLNKRSTPTADQQAAHPGSLLTESQPFHARVTKVLKHSYQVFSMSLSSDGKRLATGGLLSDRINIWDIDSGQLILELKGIAGDVGCLSFSPDGQYFAGVGGSGKAITVYVWDAHTLQVRQSIHALGHDDPSKGGPNYVKSLAFSRDGRSLAVAYSNNVIAIYDATSGQFLRKWAAPSPIVSPIVFSPDGKMLAYGGWEKNDRYILDVDSGALIANLAGHVALVETVSFSPDGQYLASGGSKNIISIYDVSSKKWILDIETGHSGYLKSLAYSPDGRLLASGALDKTVKIWDVQTGALLNTLRDHPDFVNSVLFTATGDRLIAGGGKVVTIWEISK